MATHSRFSPSSDERNTLCPPSFLLNEGEKDDQSPDAAHGTAAHHLADLCLSKGFDAETYAACTIAVGQRGDCRFVHELAPLKEDELAFEVDDEMITNVQEYVDRCRVLDGEHFSEVRVEVTKWCPDTDEFGDKLGPQFGTSDHICISFREKRITVDDLKYGKGVRVYAENNKQGAKYALGAIEEYGWMYGIDDSWTVCIRIHQPRIGNFSEWDLTVGDLRAFGALIKADLTKVWDPDAPFNPGEKQCKFCKVNARCKARLDWVHNQVGYEFDDETQEPKNDPRLMTDEELVAAYKKWPMFKALHAAQAKEITRMFASGLPVPGLKQVAGKQVRSWADKEAAKAFLEAKGITQEHYEIRTFVSPAQAEKLLPSKQRKELSGYITSVPGGPTIVDADDPREPWTAHASTLEDFESDGDDE